MSRKCATVVMAIPVLSLLLLATSASAGTVFELATRDFRPDLLNAGGFVSRPGTLPSRPPKVPMAPQEGTMTVHAQGHRLALTTSENAGKERHTILFDAQKREVTLVDHQRRVFTVMNAAAMEAARQRLAQTIPLPRGLNLEQMLKNVPAERRPKIEAMLKKQLGGHSSSPPVPARRPVVKIKKTQERQEINGFGTTKVEVLKDGMKTRETWVADWAKVEGGQEVADLLGKMSTFVREMLDPLSQGRGTKQSGTPSGGALFENIAALDGFPVLTREFGKDGVLGSETGLRSAQRKTIDPTTFEPPSGYRRQEMLGG